MVEYINLLVLFLSYEIEIISKRKESKNRRTLLSCNENHSLSISLCMSVSGPYLCFTRSMHVYFCAVLGGSRDPIWSMPLSF